MFWAVRIAEEIIKSGEYKPYHVDDMKTPSGKIHVGSLRGVVIHDLIYKSLLEKGKKAVYTYCINDMDPMDGFPPYLDRDKFYKYMGWPLCKIPSPGKGAKFYSDYYANEFIEVFRSIDCHPEIIWTSQLYKKGKFDEIIRVVLNNTEKIRKIFQDHYKSFQAKDYFPYQPICPQCGKIASTKIYKWDGEFVYFRCLKDAVDYAIGCGYEGKLKPIGDSGKMPWKIEWGAHWKLLGVTVEWSGKDHMTKGGSYFLAAKVCKEILKFPPPHAKLYEYLLTAGRKMSSSKGAGSSAAEIARILPAELLRFLLVKTHFKKTINFDPSGMTIPNLFDEYDNYAEKYYSEGIDSDYGCVWQMSLAGNIPKEKPFLPRFRDVANYIQNPAVNIKDQFEKIKGSKLTEYEEHILNDRKKYCQIWLSDYAPQDFVYSPSEKISEKASFLTFGQKKYLLEVGNLLESKEWKPDDLQQKLYALTKELNIPARSAFEALYISLIGKTHGPKAGWFLLDQDKNFIIDRFKEIAKGK